MKNQRVARRYATALMGVAEETGTVEEAARDLEAVGATIGGSRDLQRLLASPIVATVRKQKALAEIFGGRTGKLVATFIALMTSKGREALLPEVIAAFMMLRDERAGVVAADAVFALDPTREQEKALTGRLERATGKTVRLRWRTDPAIRGGLVVRVGDTVLDASVRRQLERLHERLVHGDATGTQA